MSVPSLDKPIKCLGWNFVLHTTRNHMNLLILFNQRTAWSKWGMVSGRGVINPKSSFSGSIPRDAHRSCPPAMPVAVFAVLFRRLRLPSTFTSLMRFCMLEALLTALAQLWCIFLGVVLLFNAVRFLLEWLFFVGCISLCIWKVSHMGTSSVGGVRDGRARARRSINVTVGSQTHVHSRHCAAFLPHPFLPSLVFLSARFLGRRSIELCSNYGVMVLCQRWSCRC